MARALVTYGFLKGDSLGPGLYRGEKWLYKRWIN